MTSYLITLSLYFYFLHRLKSMKALVKFDYLLFHIGNESLVNEGLNDVVIMDLFIWNFFVKSLLFEKEFVKGDVFNIIT